MWSRRSARVAVIVAISLIALVRLASLAVIWKRTGVPGFIHTYANKAAGFCLYALLPTLAIPGVPTVAPVAILVTLSVCLASALEELLIAALVSPVDLDRKTLFSRGRARRE